MFCQLLLCFIDAVPTFDGDTPWSSTEFQGGLRDALGDLSSLISWGVLFIISLCAVTVFFKIWRRVTAQAGGFGDSVYRASPSRNRRGRSPFNSANRYTNVYRRRHPDIGDGPRRVRRSR